jgi:hypothetical protein
MKPGKITENQSFAINLLYRALCVRPSGRWEEFEEIAKMIPKSLKAVHALIEDELARYAITDEFKTAERCRFKAHDTITRFERYPTRISIETVRQALINYGWRPPRRSAAHWTSNIT